MSHEYERKHDFNSPNFKQDRAGLIIVCPGLTYSLTQQQLTHMRAKSVDIFLQSLDRTDAAAFLHNLFFYKKIMYGAGHDETIEVNESWHVKQTNCAYREIREQYVLETEDKRQSYMFIWPDVNPQYTLKLEQIRDLFLFLVLKQLNPNSSFLNFINYDETGDGLIAVASGFLVMKEDQYKKEDRHKKDQYFDLGFTIKPGINTLCNYAGLDLFARAAESYRQRRLFESQSWLMRGPKGR